MKNTPSKKKPTKKSKKKKANGPTKENLRKIIEDLTGEHILPEREVPDSVIKILSTKTSGGLGYSQFNELLLYLGYNRTSHAFFQFLVDGSTEYMSRASINTADHFRNAVNEFRKVALLFFGNIQYAFDELSQDASMLEEHISRIDKRRAQNFKDRHKQVLPIKSINGKDTYFLGYIIQDELKKKLKENPNDKQAKKDEEKRKKIVELGKLNHDAYLISDHLDVYVATSMRERHEYQMVYDATRKIFSHQEIKNLKLRYFDPTQAYCMDRIDKGLAEGLMLKRAKCTIYFAQESDTFGKDSELASTLAQGKAVIAFVPRPKKTAAKERIKYLAPVGEDYGNVILQQLKLYDPNAAWDDALVNNWIKDPRSIDRDKGIARLQLAIEKQFEKRDKLLRQVHPLGIQVNLNTGVANGVLVANTVEQCAKLIKGILLRELKFELDTEQKNSGEYIYLKEKVSKSIFRVVTGDMMLTNAFWNFYLSPTE